MSTMWKLFFLIASLLVVCQAGYGYYVMDYTRSDFWSMMSYSLLLSLYVNVKE